jgi:hypothetical protein
MELEGALLFRGEAASSVGAGEDVGAFVDGEVKGLDMGGRCVGSDEVSDTWRGVKDRKGSFGVLSNDNDMAPGVRRVVYLVFARKEMGHRECEMVFGSVGMFDDGEGCLKCRDKLLGTE